MFTFGLKLWSLNKDYIQDAVRLFERGIYEYIELYVVPDSYQAMIDAWKALPIPYVIHAPHSGHGMNLAKRAALEANMTMAREAQRFADALQAEKIIFHPGVSGEIHETVFQLRQIHDARILLENKPYFSVYDESICVGHSPEEIAYAMRETEGGFCLDIGHAVCAANAKGIEPFALLEVFMRLKPNMYHLSDGDWHGVMDCHWHLGSGTFPLQQIVWNIPCHTPITIETEKNSDEQLGDFISDVEYVKQYHRLKHHEDSFCIQ